jgi:hypothetical protein
VPLNANDEVRPDTLSPSIPARRFRISSESPSPKYSWSRSALMSTNGRTAMEASRASAVAPPPPANRSHANHPSASTSTPMITKSSLRPVKRVTDCSAGTSSVRFTPAGVSS